MSRFFHARGGKDACTAFWVQKIADIDSHRVSVEGGRVVAEHRGDVVHLARSVRNVGPGIAVMQSRTVRPGAVRDPDQRTVSRFTVVRTGEDGWMVSVERHFYLDGPAPRWQRAGTRATRVRPISETNGSAPAAHASAIDRAVAARSPART